MEMEPSPPMVAKKLWKIVRIVFMMMKTGISKSKLMVDLHVMLKRGKLVGKTITNLMFHHHHHLSYSSSSFGCRSNDALNFISPKEYEFSCSNSPAFYPFYSQKRKHQNNLNHFAKSYHYDDVTTVHAVQKVLEMLNNEAAAEAAAAASPLPGFGRSPTVRQLRITDSPFPLQNEGDSQVDKQAEEFIKKFYKELKLQKKTAVESPYHYSWSRR